MPLNEWIGIAFMVAAAPFFLAGSVGLLRFPDLYCRLHALTKADNIGLGLLVLGLMIQSLSVAAFLKLLLIWLLVLLAGSTAAHLVARSALRHGLKPWERR